jgi:hypothetical protein
MTAPENKNESLPYPKVKSIDEIEVAYDILQQLENHVKTNPEVLKTPDTLSVISQGLESVYNFIILESSCIDYCYNDSDLIRLTTNYVTFLKNLVNEWLLPPSYIQSIIMEMRNLTKIVGALGQPNDSETYFEAYFSTLKTGFENPNFLLNDPNILTEAIREFACATLKNISDTPPVQKIASAKKSHFLAGYLESTLKFYNLSGVYPSDNLPTALKATNLLRENLYSLYSPLLDKNVLGYIVFRDYLSTSYAQDATETNPVQLCISPKYKGQCTPDPKLFSEKHICPPKTREYDIAIEHNGISEAELTKSCDAMRHAEKHLDWIKNHLAVKPTYEKGECLIRSARSQDEYHSALLLEGKQFPEDVLGFYRQKDETSEGGAQGIAYVGSVRPEIVVHEYVHHLIYLILRKSKLPKSLSEGLPELLAGGACNPRQDSWVFTHFANDTDLLRDLATQTSKVNEKTYVDGLKLAAFFVNMETSLYKAILTLPQKGKEAELRAVLESYFADPTHVKKYLDFEYKRIAVCSEYNTQYPDWPEKPTIFLDEIISQLNANHSTSAMPASTHDNPVVSDLSHNSPTVSNSTTPVPDNTQSSDNLALVTGKQPTVAADWQWQAIFQPIGKATMPTVVSSLVTVALKIWAKVIANKAEEGSKSRYLPIANKWLITPLATSLINSGGNIALFGTPKFVADFLGVENDFLNFGIYLGVNWPLSTIAQGINGGIAKCFSDATWSLLLLQSLTSILLWNPALFMSEAFMNNIIPMLMTFVVNGFLSQALIRGAKGVIDNWGMISTRISKAIEHYGNFCMEVNEDDNGEQTISSAIRTSDASNRSSFFRGVSVESASSPVNTKDQADIPLLPLV